MAAGCSIPFCFKTGTVPRWSCVFDGHIQKENGACPLVSLLHATDYLHCLCSTRSRKVPNMVSQCRQGPTAAEPIGSFFLGPGGASVVEKSKS